MSGFLQHAERHLTVQAMVFLMLVTQAASAAPITISTPPLDFPRSTATLSQGRYHLAATSVGTKAMFGGGGEQAVGHIYDIVDVYDAATGNWTVEHLSVKRMSLAATTVGDTVVFAGGAPCYDLHETLDTVDLYNNATGVWTTAQLSEPRNRLAATAHGTKAYISGGVVTTSAGRPSEISDAIDVYDASTGQWSVMTMPRERYSHESVTVGDKILFAGGNTDGSSIVDIYDTTTSTWSTGQLSSNRRSMASAVAGDCAIFVGGEMGSQYRDEIDIYDASTDTWSSAELPHKIGNLAGTAAGGLALFGGGVYTQYYDDVYVYDPATDTWTTTALGLSEARFSLVATSVGSTALFAGGYGFDTVDLFVVPEPGACSLLLIGTAWMVLLTARRSLTQKRD